MAEQMIPILPCHSIDENLDFYRALGFAVPYQQTRPNPYAVVRRGDVELHFFSMKGYDPTQSYSSCSIQTTDVDGLYEAFRGGLKAALGRLPSRGLPRIGPLKDMAYGVRQFLITDPGGNTLRVGPPSESYGYPKAPMERFAKALQTATLMGDSKEDPAAAAKVLDRILASDAPRSAIELVRALILRADMAMRMGDRELAEGLLKDVRMVDLTDDERVAVSDDLRRAEDIPESA